VGIEKVGHERPARVEFLPSDLERGHAVQLLIDPESDRIVDANPAACTFYGRPHQELTALRFSDLDVFEPERLRGALAQASAGHRNRLVIQHRLASGETRDVEVHSGPVEVGGRRLLFSIVHDVSDRTRAEEALYKTSQAFEAALDGMAILRADGTYVYLNEAHARIYGYERPEELLGRSWRVLYDDDELARIDRVVMPELAREGRWRGEAMGRRRDGRRFPQELSLSSLAGGGMACVVRDISARRQAEKLQDALYRIAETASTVRDVEALYPALHGIVGELMYAHNFYIALQEGDLIRFPYFVDELETAPSPRVPGRGLTEHVLRTGQPRLVNADAMNELVASGEVELLGAPSLDWLGAPLMRGERAFGVLAVQSYREDVRFTAQDKDVLTFVSSQVAAAIDRRRAADALRESESRFRTLAETAPCAITIDQAGECRYANPAAAVLFGYSERELLGLNLLELVHPDHLDVAHEMAASPASGANEPIRREIRIVRKDGQERWLDFSMSTIEHGGKGAALVTAFDITDRKRADEQIKSLAYHDALTGLPNRLLLHDRLGLAVAQAHRARQKLAVLFLDLDRFKLINDSLGHALGDRVLQTVAARLQTAVREGDTVARVGGDEFILLLPGVERPLELARVAEKICEALREPLALDDQELFVTPSMGISLYPEDGEDAETLVKHADAAMYRAKDQGRNRYQLYTPSMNEGATERLARENRLRRALREDELRVHYQPVVDLASGRISGVEALLRWQDPARGLVPAADFISLAESTGLIVPIGTFVLRAACAQARAWHDRGHPGLRISVNLSARQLRQAELPHLLGEILAETGLDAACLDLEITESQALGGGDLTRAALQRLRTLGVRLIVDDFGIGSPSLSFLRGLPVDALKIDRSFVHDLDTREGAAVATAVIALAHALDLQVVAEGVETEGQRAFLAAHACDRVQGYLLGHPLPAEACEAVLARRA
jgi:diguanylate cyclase (GGDEF)-like protein/PAS domain S-box-containing protein